MKSLIISVDKIGEIKNPFHQMVIDLDRYVIDEEGNYNLSIDGLGFHHEELIGFVITIMTKDKDVQ